MNPASTTSLSTRPLLAPDDDDGDLSISSSSQSPQSWEQLRRQARQVENELEIKLASLSKLGASVSSPAASTMEGIQLDSVGKPSQELEIEELLKKV